MGVEGKAALNGELADRHEGARVLHLDGEVAERLQVAGIRQLLRRIDVEGECDLLQRGGAQQTQGPDTEPIVEGCSGRRVEFGRRAERQAGLIEFSSRELPVIGDRLQGGLLVEGFGLGSVLLRLGGSALPVGGPGERDRRLGDASGLREVSPGRRRIVVEPQGDPARVKLGLDPLLNGAGAVPARHAVGGLGVAEIEELASDDPTLDPPLIAVDEDVGIGGGSGEDSRSLDRLVGPAQVLRARQDVGGIVAQRGRHGIQGRQRSRALVFHGPARPHQAPVGSSCIACGTARRLPVLLQQRPFHAVAMVDARENAWEGIEHFRLQRAAESFIAPQFTHEGGCIRIERVGLEGEGEGELARRARGLRRGEEGSHRSRALPLREQCLLGSAPQERTRRPTWIGPSEGDRALEPDTRTGTDRNPFQQRPRRRVREIVAQAIPFAHLALTVKVDRLA